MHCATLNQKRQPLTDQCLWELLFRARHDSCRKLLINTVRLGKQRSQVTCTSYLEAELSGMHMHLAIVSTALIINKTVAQGTSDYYSFLSFFQVQS